MQFNSDSDNLDLVTFANKRLSFDDNTEGNARFPLSEKAMYANQGMRKVWAWIGEAYGGWVFDDLNQTDLPRATADLASGQDTYTLPVDSSKIRGVYVKNTGGTWNKVDPITLEQILATGQAEPEFLKTDGQPRYYRFIGESMQLYPAADYTQSASLKLEFTRDISAFASTDTTKEPGFDQQFHEAIGVYMALQYAKNKLLDVRAELRVEWQDYERSIKRTYRKKFNELFPPKIRVVDELPTAR